jgi:hypothetical protein
MGAERQTMKFGYFTLSDKNPALGFWMSASGVGTQTA